MPNLLLVLITALFLLVALSGCGEDRVYTTSAGRTYVCKIDATDPIVARADYFKSTDSLVGLTNLLDSIRDMGEANWTGYVLYNIGKVRGGDERWSYYRRAHAEFARGEPLVLGRFLQLSVNAASSYLNQQGKQDSLVYFARSGIAEVLACEQCPLDSQKAVELYDLALLGLRELGDFEGAIYFMDQGVAANDRFSPAYWRSGRIMRNSAWLNGELGNLDLAEEQVRRSERYFLENKMDKTDSTYLAETYQTFVFLADKRTDGPALEAAARKTMLLNLTLRPESVSMGNSYNNLGLGLIRQGKYSAGEDTLELALQLYRKNDELVSPGKCYENFAESRLSQGDTLSALAYLDSAEQAYHGYPANRNLTFAIDKEELKDPLVTHARLSWQRHLSLAKIDFMRYELSPGGVPLEEIRYRAARVDSIISLLQYRVRSEFSKRQNIRELRGFYEELIAFGYKTWRKTGDADYLDFAQEYLESSKARILRERQQRTYARLSNPSDAANDDIYAAESRVKKLRNKLRTRAATSFEEQQTNQLALRQAEFELRGIKDEAYDPNEVNIVYQRRTLSLEAVRRQLEPGQMVLDYFVGEKDVYVSYATRERKEMLRLDISPRELRTKITSLRKGLAAPENELRWDNNKQWRDSLWRVYLTSANELYDALLAPVLQQQPGVRQLTVIPDGLLTYVPFGALLQGLPTTTEYSASSGLPFVLKNYTINYEFSTGIWEDRLKAPHSGKRQHLLVAPTQEKERPVNVYGVEESVLLPPLGSGDKERAAVVRYLSPEVWAGPEATMFAGQRDFSRFGIVHFTGHGYAFPSNPMASFLALDLSSSGTQELLKLPELEAMRMNVDLLVLSACQTAVGEVAIEEGVISLARAGTIAGARSVISSLWYVNQEAKAKMFDAFYEELATGERRDEALRGTQLRLLSEQAGFAHPYYWAGFMNTGSGAAVAID